MNTKIKISNNAFVYPMPMVIVGAKVNGKDNFMAVGWVTRVNAAPPKIAIALGNRHHTNKGIIENQSFSISVPSLELMQKTDYCGLVSGEKIDKSRVFEVFYGELLAVPMVKECPLCMECKLTQTVDLETNTLFIGQIMNAYTEDKYLSDGKLDVTKINPFTLTMPDNNYWSVGKNCGKAWNSGSSFK